MTCAVQATGITLAVPTEVCDWQGMRNPPENRNPPARPGTAFEADVVTDGFADPLAALACHEGGGGTCREPPRWTGRSSANRKNRSTRMAKAVNTVKPPPENNMPNW